MAKTTKGQSWMQRHLNDPFVKKAQQQGWRSRASFKLIDLQQKDRLFQKGMRVLDLGASPGGWSQVVAKAVAPSGQVIALDKLMMAPIAGVTFIQGDFFDQSVIAELTLQMKQQPLDWLISDMSPNLSGIIAVDQVRIMALAEEVLTCLTYLKQGGGFLVKLFQGSGFEAYIKQLRACFQQVLIRKPAASRGASRELYVLARGYYNE